MSNPERTIEPSLRAPIEHKVKSWPHLFEATRLGCKLHDIRRINERDYRAGDMLILEEFDPETQTYSGRKIRSEITYVTSVDKPCALFEDAIHPGFCILSIKLIDSADLNSPSN